MKGITSAVTKATGGFGSAQLHFNQASIAADNFKQMMDGIIAPAVAFNKSQKELQAITNVSNEQLEGISEKAHGRISIRNYKYYNIKGFDFYEHWKESNISTLCIVDRHFTEIKTGKIMQDTAFYISNKVPQSQKLFVDMANAIRKH